jgi:membrane protease YdiL (CAAX protease family)
MIGILASVAVLRLQAEAQPLPAPLPVDLPPHPAVPAVPPIGDTLLHMALPLLGYFLVLPLVYYFFRRTWRELDVESIDHQRSLLASGEYDRRPLALFAITAVVLTLQYYYDRDFYLAYLKPYLKAVEADPTLMPWGLGEYVSVRKYGELYPLAWWVFTRFVGYTVIPFTTWKILFPKDSLLDFGLRTKGLLSHAWIYVLCLSVVLPAVFIVASQPDFGNYYPFYKTASRSWVDFLSWEAMYIMQFFGLEIFFRGFWLNALRKSMGSAAIFAMVVPYCMIHFGKPYFETCGAVVAGIALGSLSMRTKSIYSGFLVHVTVAILMDTLALSQHGALPVVWIAPDPPANVPVWLPYGY